MFGACVRRATFKKELSYVDQIKSFDDNISVTSSLSYLQDLLYMGIVAIAYQEPVTVKVNRSFVLLPETPEMMPRMADPRIGYFTSNKEEIADDYDGVKMNTYANKWNVYPKDVEAYKRGELVEPTQPILFYVDDAFPEEWKKGIHEGVLVWNKAFERIGFKNVMQVKDFPKDDPEFDPANIKYNCINYAPIGIANAMGPSWIDPRNSQIINASVFVYHDVIQLVNDMRFVQTAQVDPRVRTPKLPQDVLDESLRYIISHEVGHCLGLMHNMGSSFAYATESYRDPVFMQEHGTTPSIMDYARNNYIAQPGDKERGVRLTPPELGAYDYYAIAWLYSPIFEAKTAEEEIPILDKWISEKSGDVKYRYGKQQFRRRFDPSSVEEDLGDDPVKASEYGRRNLQYLLKHINDWVADKDKDFEFRTAVYDEIVYAYVRYLTFVLGDIGGIYLNERYDGDQRPSFKTVSKQQQKKALNFLLNELKDLSWLDARETLKEFPIRTSVAMQMEDAIIDGILSRCGAVAICSGKATSAPYTQKEYLADIERFVWAPTRAGRTLTETEMRLQMNYLTKLIEGSVAGVAKNATRKGIADMYAHIEVPEWLKTASRERFGIISEEFMGCFNNKPREMQAARLEEISGFDDDVDLKAPIEPMEHIYYGELKKVRSLVAASASTGSADTQRHYRLLLYKIDQALK